MDYKLPKRIENSNKGTYGKVLNIAGSDYMPGAAYLSSVSALKVGCGYCFLASTERVIDAVAAQTSNLVFLPRKEVLLHLSSSDVVEIGCGLSQNREVVELFQTVINNLPQNLPLIIDADGLNILSTMPEFFTSKKLLNVIFTPHPKEAARLLDCALDEVLKDTGKAAEKISKIYNAVTVLKTHKTVVIAPDGRKYLNTTGNNSMAKAGSGDVLTGMIAGLAAQGMDLFEASALGVYLHGLCGDIAAENLTAYSVMAQDLINFIPEAIKKSDLIK